MRLLAIGAYSVKSPGLVGEFTRYEVAFILIREGVNKYLIIRALTPWMAAATQGVRNSDKRLVLRRINPGQDLFAQD